MTAEEERDVRLVEALTEADLRELVLREMRSARQRRKAEGAGIIAPMNYFIMHVSLKALQRTVERAG